MKVISKEQLYASKQKNMKLLKSSVFVYPTDSIYGLGCNATDEKLVEKIRTLKNSRIQPFSVIAPSKEWVYKNCEVTEKEKPYVEKLGKKIDLMGEQQCFTLILKLKNKKAIARNVNQGQDTIGVRIPKHWFSEIVEELGVPIVTTSANPTGDNFMTSLDNLNPKIEKKVDLIIYEGENEGNPSTIINLVEKFEVKQRK